MIVGKKHWKPAQSWVAFALLIVTQLWATHLIGFFAHEYAHAILAWLLGWKSNPFALHYGHLTAANLLMQGEIDENVNYAPISSAGHGWQAGMIAAAGAAIGNGLVTYPLSLWGYAMARRRDSRTWAMFSYWLCVMSIGNFVDYVPVRTFSFREDMHTVVRGFDCSPWWVLFVLGVPFGIAVVRFFARFAPDALRWLLPESPTRRGVLVCLTAFAVFCFFGAAGLSNSGAVSHWISVASIYLLFPGMTVAGWLLTNRMPLRGNEVA